MKHPVLLATVFGLLLYVVFGAISFAIAGTWRLPFFWAVFVSQLLICFVGVGLLDPDLIAERMRPRGKDEDPYARLVLSILLPASLFLAAADVGRWHISSVPVWLQLVALVVHIFGWIGVFWAMMTNRFFSSAIRLQPDREQRVIDEGPYAFIRHPGYAFAALLFIMQGIALGSWISEIPVLIMVPYLIYRTFLEEKMLREGLPGYTEYAAKVRYRWIPGVW
jgi:protein-S-isoprenylcysteine O-methyltransferase Ste14